MHQEEEQKKNIFEKYFITQLFAFDVQLLCTRATLHITYEKMKDYKSYTFIKCNINLKLMRFLCDCWWKHKCQIFKHLVSDCILSLMYNFHSVWCILATSKTTNSLQTFNSLQKNAFVQLQLCNKATLRMKCNYLWKRSFTSIGISMVRKKFLALVVNNNLLL